jgi:hypothetical protein
MGSYLRETSPIHMRYPNTSISHLNIRCFTGFAYFRNEANFLLVLLLLHIIITYYYLCE